MSLKETGYEGVVDWTDLTQDRGQKIFLPVKPLLASQEGLLFMELVGWDTTLCINT